MTSLSVIHPQPGQLYLESMTSQILSGYSESCNTGGGHGAIYHQDTRLVPGTLSLAVEQVKTETCWW